MHSDPKPGRSVLSCCLVVPCNLCKLSALTPLALSQLWQNLKIAPCAHRPLSRHRVRWRSMQNTPSTLSGRFPGAECPREVQQQAQPSSVPQREHSTSKQSIQSLHRREHPTLRASPHGRGAQGRPCALAVPSRDARRVFWTKIAREGRSSTGGRRAWRRRTMGKGERGYGGPFT